MFKIDDHRFVVNDLRPLTHHQQRVKVVTLQKRPVTNHTPYRYRLSPLTDPPVVKAKIEICNKVHLTPLDRLKALQKLKKLTKSPK